MSHNELLADRIALIADFPARTNADLANLESGNFFQRKLAETQSAETAALAAFESRQIRHKLMVARDATKS